MKAAEKDSKGFSLMQHEANKKCKERIYPYILLLVYYINDLIVNGHWMDVFDITTFINTIRNNDDFSFLLFIIEMLSIINIDIDSLNSLQ